MSIHEIEWGAAAFRPDHQHHVRYRDGIGFDDGGKWQASLGDPRSTSPEWFKVGEERAARIAAEAAAKRAKIEKQGEQIRGASWYRRNEEMISKLRAPPVDNSPPAAAST